MSAWPSPHDEPCALAKARATKMLTHVGLIEPQIKWAIHLDRTTARAERRSKTPLLTSSLRTLGHFLPHPAKNSCEKEEWGRQRMSRWRRPWVPLLTCELDWDWARCRWVAQGPLRWLMVACPNERRWAMATPEDLPEVQLRAALSTLRQVTSVWRCLEAVLGLVNVDERSPRSTSKSLPGGRQRRI
jgi:hypothetical protein